MFNRRGIYWLSSYPKSGNTWFRIVLARLLAQPGNFNDYINDIDSILGSPMLVSRTWMNKILGFDSMLLSENELEELRPAAHQWYAEQVPGSTFIKSHDAYTYTQKETPLFPAQGCLGAIYFVRNPLDVAVSLAHHAQCSLDASIYMMGNKDFSVPLESQRDKQLRQRLLTWSLHVQSWVEQDAIEVLVLRYEDMFYNPLETFTRAMQFLKVNIACASLEQAIHDASFAKLQAYEKQFGFKEKPTANGKFFRRGIVGDWKEKLNVAQIQQVIKDHGPVMRAYGYLDDNDKPV